MKKNKKFRVSASQVMRLNLTPGITFMSELRLFLGVPKWAKYFYNDIKTNDFIFTNKQV